jgi:flagella basal body P-ring formation protein FlgA
MNILMPKSKLTGVLARMAYIVLAAVSISGLVNVCVATEISGINVFDNAQVDGEKILLGEIARINGSDQKLMQQLKDIVIGQAPLPGRSRMIESDYLKWRLKQNGIDLAGLDLQCPQEIEISRSYIEVNQDEIEKIVSGFLHQNVLKGNQDANIKDLRVPESVILPKGRLTYEVVASPQADFLGKIPLSIQFSVDGHFQKKLWATATIEMLTKVVVAKKSLGKHRPITEEDIELQKMDLADLPSNVITDPESVIGKRTTNAVYAHKVLTTDLIELPPLVRRGDVVVIVAETKWLRITALGKVKKTGRLGERIPVENFDSKKILYAEVVDSRTVKVEF